MSMRIAVWLTYCMIATSSFSTSNSASAEVYQVGPSDDWFQWLSEDKLKPGDQLVLSEGVYGDVRRLVLRHQVEIKQGSFGNRISFNLIHDTNYPGITVYGTAGERRNVIDGNVIWNTGDHGIQAAADAILRDNLIANARGCGIYSRKHQGAEPGNLRIENNTIFASENPAIRLIGDGGSTAGIELVGNTLMGADKRVTVRIDQLAPVHGIANRGSGTIEGSEAVQSSWTLLKNVLVKLPTPSDNPAWKTLKRSDVLSNFVLP